MKKPGLFQGRAGRRQLLAALGSLSALSLLAGRFSGRGGNRLLPAGKKDAVDCSPGTGKTARMLTQDGRLVEIDPDLGRLVKSASKEELRDWIKPNKL